MFGSICSFFLFRSSTGSVINWDYNDGMKTAKAEMCVSVCYVYDDGNCCYIKDICWNG